MTTIYGRTTDLASFKTGDRVIYVPIHAKGDIQHPDSERGVVSSVGRRFVFVRFGLQATAQACDPNDLVKVDAT